MYYYSGQSAIYDVTDTVHVCTEQPFSSSDRDVFLPGQSAH